VVNYRDIRDAESGESRLINRPVLRNDGIMDTIRQVGSPGSLGAKVFNNKRVRFVVGLKGKILIPDGLTE